MLSAAAFAQGGGRPEQAPAQGNAGGAVRIENASAQSYVLGAGDEISVWVRDLEEISRKAIRIENDGFISLPVAGRVRASGLTVRQLEDALEKTLKTQLLEPQVTIGMAEFRSQPISVQGAVAKPGIYQVQGKKTLIEILSMAEGLRQDAGRTVTITRRMERGAIPVAGATTDPTGQYSVARIDLKGGLLDPSNPEHNIAMQPDDVVTIPPADKIYVFGEVKRAGGFVLNDRETLTVMQALALAEGLNRTASAKGARIYREDPASEKRIEIAVNLGKVLDGKAEDIRLRPNDILYVPNSVSKNAAIRSLEMALQIGTGVAVYRR